MVSAMKKAWEAGFAAGAGLTGDVDSNSALLEEKMASIDFWNYDSQKPTKKANPAKRAPKTPSPKKPTGEPEELAALPYDKSRCRARKYNKGYPLQCWKIPAEEGGVCHLCSARADDSEQDFWGYYDEPLEDCCLNAKGKPHAWKSLASARAEKKASDREEKRAAKEKVKAEKEEEKTKKKAMKEAEKAKKKAEQEKKKRLKELKKKASAEKEVAEDVVENANVEEPKEEKPQEKAEPVIEESKDEEAEGPTYSPGSPRDEGSSENELDEDTQSIGGEPEDIFEEYVHDGYTMKWNKVTNDLLDPDDDEVLGKMVFDDEGNPKAEINVDDSDDSDEE